MIDLHALGPVRALVGGRGLDIGHARQRSLLAMLLVDVNNVVPSERLAELVWDDRPPRQARNTLAGYATRLRKALAGAPPGRPVPESRAGGYVLRVEPAAVDLCRFREKVARAAVVRDDEERAGLLRDALAQWSGTALSDLWGTRVESLRTTLESERQAALLDFFHQLRLGHPQEILAQLQRMAEERPYDEELRCV